MNFVEYFVMSYYSAYNSTLHFLFNPLCISHVLQDANGEYKQCTFCIMYYIYVHICSIHRVIYIRVYYSGPEDRPTMECCL